MSKLCACGCRERVSNPRRQFAPGHSFQNARLWRTQGKPDAGRGSPLIRYNKPLAEAPDPVEQKEPIWSPKPDEWYQAKVTRCKNGAMFLELSNGDQVFVPPRTKPDYPLSHQGLTVRVRLTRSDTGCRWRALEVRAPDFDQDAEEVAVVTEFNGHWGSVVRPCGCFLYVSTCEEVYVGPGDQVVVSEFNHDGIEGHHYIATEIQLVLGDSQ